MTVIYVQERQVENGVMRTVRVARAPEILVSQF